MESFFAVQQENVLDRRRDRCDELRLSIIPGSQAANVDQALAELAERIAARAQENQRASVNASGRQQAKPDVAFTHSQFEGFVRHHASGRWWPLRTWEQDSPALLSLSLIMTRPAASSRAA